MKHGVGDRCDSCEEKLKSAHPILQSWFIHVKKDHPSCHISWSFRDQASQTEAFKTGHSQLEWPKSKHNHMEDGQPCSLALDLFEIDPQGRALFNPMFYFIVYKQSRDRDDPIEWGGNWSHFKDKDHYQIKE